MAGTRIKVKPIKKARIEIIPLIDVIFFLLATFVLFTLSLNRIQSVPVNLPFSSQNPTPPEQTENDMVTIQITDAGNLFWNKELIDNDELASRIMHYKTQTKDPRILVAGDDKARFGATIFVLDEVRKADIEKVSIETRIRPTGK